MKTFRELINLVESAQTSADSDVEHLANAFADIYYGGAGMGMISATEKIKLARNIVQAVEDGRLSIEELKQDLHDVDQLQKKLGRDGRFDEPGVAEGGIGDEIKHGVKGIKRKMAGKPSRQDVKDKYYGKALTAQWAGDDAEADKNASRWARVHNNTNSGKISEQGVAEGTEQQYRIYFVIPEHEDYDDRHAPTETTIVTASSANEAGKKFKFEVPEAYIEQIVPLNYNKGVVEAISRKDLLKQVVDKLNDPEFRKKPADPTKRWEKGDLYQGPGPDDYGYTGYQGHGMPRDNPKKKKGVAEDTNQKYAVRMNAQQLGSTNRSKYTWTGTAGSDDQAREMAIAYADRHGFKNIVVKEISKQEQTVDEQATPEAVAKINSLFSK